MLALGRTLGRADSQGNRFSCLNRTMRKKETDTFLCMFVSMPLHGSFVSSGIFFCCECFEVHGIVRSAGCVVRYESLRCVCLTPLVILIVDTTTVWPSFVLSLMHVSTDAWAAGIACDVGPSLRNHAASHAIPTPLSPTLGALPMFPSSSQRTRL